LPVIKHVLDTPAVLTRVMGTPNRLAQALRDSVIPMVSRLAPFQHAFVQRLSELDIAYRGSPIVEGPGQRHLEESMRGGQGIGRRFLLLIGDDVDAPTRAAATELCASFGDVIESRSSSHPGLTLVRPDGYVAYASPHGDGRAALAELRSVLQRQTAPPERE